MVLVEPVVFHPIKYVRFTFYGDSTLGHVRGVNLNYFYFGYRLRSG